MIAPRRSGFEPRPGVGLAAVGADANSSLPSGYQRVVNNATGDIEIPVSLRRKAPAF